MIVEWFVLVFLSGYNPLVLVAMVIGRKFIIMMAIRRKLIVIVSSHLRRSYAADWSNSLMLQM